MKGRGFETCNSRHFQKPAFQYGERAFCVGGGKEDARAQLFPMHNRTQWVWRGTLLTACALLLTAGGCRDGGGGDAGTAQVRLINAVPGPEELTVAVDGRRVWRRSLFRSNTGYGSVREGTYPLQVAVGNTPASGRMVLSCRDGETYTVLALGGGAGIGPDVRVFSDTRPTPVPGDKARICVLNAASDTDAIDILFNNIVGAPGIVYGTRSPALLLDAGTYDLKVNAAGDVASLAGPVSLRLRAGHAYTLAVMGKRGSVDPQQSLSLEAYPDDAPKQ